MSNELWQLDAVDLARLIRFGRVSSREATQSCLARLHAVNPTINAVVRTLETEALQAAHAADKARSCGDVLGPLHGVPVTTKVNTDQIGCPTDNGVVAFRDNIATQDAPVVANLRAAGAILLGRTNTPAFSMRLFTENALHGRTLNPQDHSKTAGGSSGGAGAAVAAGIGPISQGNDIAGSVRYPAYACGIVGLRPTPGRIASYSPSAPAPRPIGAQLFAVQGPITRSVRDARLAFAVMAGADRRDTRWVDVPLQGPPPPRPLRAALVPNPEGATTRPALSEAVRTAGRHLAAAGYVVEEIAPPDFALATDLWRRVCGTDVLTALAPRVEEFADDAAKRSLAFWRQHHPPEDLAGYIAALADRDFLIQRWLTFLMDWPVIVLPSSCDLPLPAGMDAESYANQAHLWATNPQQIAIPVLGLPSLAVPVGDEGKLRLGVQIVAARYREDLCLAAGEIIEAGEGGPRPVRP